MKPKELVKQLKIEKGCNYLIFVSRETGLYPEDLQKINLMELGAKNALFVYVEGNIAKLIKPLKLK